MFWDFLSLTPESIHQVTILFSTAALPDLSQHERLRQPYLHVVQQKGRLLLGKIPFQNRAGDREFYGRGSGQHERQDPDCATAIFMMR